MADFVFTSPGVKFKERDLSFVTRNVGITTLGLVGETLKGPAFEPVFIQDKNQFRERFGGQSIGRYNNGDLKFHLPYVANSYLDESSQLWVTRVLGLSGYNAGTAWAVTLDAGIDPSTITIDDVTSTLSTGFTENTFLGVRINSTGDTGVTFAGFEKINATDFEGYSYSFTATTLNSSTGAGTVDYVRTKLVGTSYSNYENMVLAVIRSKARVQDVVNGVPETIYDTYQTGGLTIDTLNANNSALNGDLFGNFVLEATNAGTNPETSDPTGSTVSYVVSMNPNSSSFLPNVIGRDPIGDSKIFVEATYPDLIRMLDIDGMEFSGLTSFGIDGIAPFGYGIKNTLIEATTESFTDYETGFKTPETPWIVSQIRGNKIDKLFKFHSISDGNAANREIKISVANINPITGEFDIQVRDFNDTDDNPVILESFVRCTLIEQQNNFIGRRIGTIDGDYDLKSNFIMLELADTINPDAFPAGFEGYMEKDWSDFGGVAPKKYYKTKYEDNERIRRVYLGISELGYSTSNLRGRGINQNFYNFFGLTGFVQGMGFHMDSNADNTKFVTGEGNFQTIDNILDVTNPYNELNSRKFTLVPAGGFDGWNLYREGRSNTDGFQMNGIFDGVEPNVTPSNDFQAWETAIATFANPEEVTINLFSTPGLNWSDHNILVKDTIEMVEIQRTDTLYVIDSPDLPIEQAIGERRVDVDASRNIVDLLDDAEIDSNYACTYFPWIQFRDSQNNANVYIPPTGEVVKAMAFTDNTSFPWFAPAGLNRGVTNARRSKYKLSLEARDILYAGRINPIADFADVGTAIFGQKTLQKRESALDRINVRRLLLQIKVLISNIAIRLIFEQNDQATIDQFLQKATPVLDTIRRERGLQDFRIKMDESNNTPETLDRNELYGEIFLKPTRALEYIGITFTITPSGAAFEDFGA